MRITLYQPDIPQNTGTILRLGACLGVPVDVIGPTGFDMSDRALRRAGLDYLAYVKLERHIGFDAFNETRSARGERLILVTRSASTPYTDFSFRENDVIMLGRESAGVPDAIHALADARIMIPMCEGMRSLNVAVAGAMVLGEALRQTRQFPGVQSASE